MQKNMEEAKANAIRIKNDEQFVKCIPLNDATMDLYLERMILQDKLTNEELINMDFFDKAKVCFDFYTKVKFG